MLTPPRLAGGDASGAPGRSGTGESESGKDAAATVVAVLASALPGATLPDGSLRRDVTVWQLGLDSLAALRLVHRLRRACGRDVPRACVFATAATPHSVARAVAAAPRAASIGTDTHGVTDEPFPLSATQRAWLPGSAGSGLSSAPSVT